MTLFQLDYWDEGIEIPEDEVVNYLDNHVFSSVPCSLIVKGKYFPLSKTPYSSIYDLSLTQCLQILEVIREQ